MAHTHGRTMAVLYSVVLMDLLGFGIMIPLLPFLALSFGATSATLGAMATAFSLLQMVGNCVLGVASDKLGRRKVLCVCLLGSALSYAAFGCAWSLEGLVLLRALSGFFSGTIGCAQAYISAVVPAKDRGQYMGYIGACIGAGFAVGPGLGALLTHLWGFRGPCYFAATLCFLNFLSAVAVLEEPVRKLEPLLPTAATPVPEPPQKTPSSLRERLQERWLCLPVFCSTALYYLAFAIFDCMGALYFQYAFQLSAGEFGALSTLSGLGALLLQRFCVKQVIAQLGEVRAGVGAHGCRVVAYLLVAICRAQWAPYLTGLLISGGSILAPCSATLLSQLAPEESRGAVLGLNQSFAALGRVLGPLLAAIVYAREPAGIWYLAVVCSILGGAVLLLMRSPAEAAEDKIPKATSSASDVAKPQSTSPPGTPPGRRPASPSPERLHRSAHRSRVLSRAESSDLEGSAAGLPAAAVPAAAPAATPAAAAATAAAPAAAAAAAAAEKAARKAEQPEIPPFSFPGAAAAAESAEKAMRKAEQPEMLQLPLPGAVTDSAEAN